MRRLSLLLLLLLALLLPLMAQADVLGSPVPEGATTLDLTRLTKAVQDQGFHYFDWNVDSDDAGKAKTADEVFRNVTKGCANKNYSIVLQHDIKGFSVDAVEDIIIWGLQNGFTFEKLTENSPGSHHKVQN